MISINKFKIQGFKSLSRATFLQKIIMLKRKLWIGNCCRNKIACFSLWTVLAHACFHLAPPYILFLFLFLGCFFITFCFFLMIKMIGMVFSYYSFKVLVLIVWPAKDSFRLCQNIVQGLPSQKNHLSLFIVDNTLL